MCSCQNGDMSLAVKMQKKVQRLERGAHFKTNCKCFIIKVHCFKVPNSWCTFPLSELFYKSLPKNIENQMHMAHRLSWQGVILDIQTMTPSQIAKVAFHVVFKCFQ